MLECSDGSIYTGYTSDPVRRVAEHNKGKGSRYTRSRLPVRMVYLEEFGARSAALRRESRIKRMQRREKLSLCRTQSGTSHSPG